MRILKATAAVVICVWVAPSAWSQATAVANNVLLTGTIQEAAITESSGLIASRRFPGVFWTHNDAGSTGVLFAITKQGQSIGAFEVRGVEFNDLEDIAVDGSGNLYLADIGDNGGNRSTLFVHRLKEPNPGVGNRIVTVNRSWRLKFPGDRDDA